MITIDLELLTMQKEVLNALIVGGKFEPNLDDTVSFLKGIVAMLAKIEEELNNEQQVEFSAKPKVRVLVQIQDASFQSLSSNVDLEYVVVDTDDNGDEPVVVGNINAPDNLIGLNEKFHVEIYRGDLSPDEKLAKQLLKEIDF